MTEQAVVQMVAGHPRRTGQAAVRGHSIRPVTGSDARAIAAMWERCALATRTARFHAPVRNIPTSYLNAVFADPSSSIVAVCHHRSALVALASLIPGDSRDSAELGVLVEDAWQRAGIGRRLVTRLIATARARGITSLTASVLAENAKVADLLRQIPGEFSLAFDGPVLKVRICLASLKTGSAGQSAQISHSGSARAISPARQASAQNGGSGAPEADHAGPVQPRSVTELAAVPRTQNGRWAGLPVLDRLELAEVAGAAGALELVPEGRPARRGTSSSATRSG
jgi:GNAT superfamily N-acetyltransferase